MRHALGEELQLLDKEIHHEPVSLMEDEIIHFIDGPAGLLEQLLDALGHLADGEIKDIHAIHEDLEIGADIAVFTLALNTRVGRDGMAHSRMYLEGVLAAAVGIEHEGRIAIVALLNEGRCSRVTIERPIHLVTAVNDLRERLTIEQQDTVDAVHRSVSKSRAQCKQISRASQRDVKTHRLPWQAQAVLQQAGSGGNAVIGRLAHEQEHIDAPGLNAVVGHELLCRLEAQVACRDIVIGDAPLHDTNVVDGFFYFFLGDEISQVLIRHNFSGDTSGNRLYAHSMK